MASCDDDFSLLNDDHHHLHHFTSHHRYLQPKISSGAGNAISNDVVKVSSTGGGCGSHENGAVYEVNPYESADFDSVPESESDPKSSRVGGDATEKRKERERENLSLSNGSYKKTKSISGAGGIIVPGACEYRKDREEWSDTAIECLLDAYTEKYTQLNRGNLRGRDWEEVAAIVSERCENQNKSVEQCKNKVDNLKKRYKLERHRMSSAGVSVSHWPWFKKMEAIVGNSLPAKSASDEDKISGSGGSSGRQQKRYSAGPSGSLGQVNSMKSKSIPNSKWQRVVFKISGAALAGNGPHNVDPKVVTLVAREIETVYRLGVQVAIVIGGRNFFCGDIWMTETGADRSTTYQLNMMANMMNSVLLQSALEKMGVQTRLQTAFVLPEVGEPYNRQRAIRHLEKGRVVIFGGVGGGSGNPLFSTDTTAALRATDLNAQAVLKGTNVDAFYDCNSRNSGISFEHLSFREAASRVVVFNLLEPGNISRALCGEQIGTLIDQTGMIS
ncbi:uridylate kinase PUMPKIN, chloroplastic isoform X2 [Amaranthus tricolor]|uniref:uridylate kinase PUMPKIN, chloroplastic isoform X2 n=1 Tax=Amaranthus tricolor TaxID=29722 RepID=UPI00258CE23E|nr:uridylate kinase PUMPKIN, chloroplastic isoform X2 [Amaranthus tricolor]